jgi:hypothetical protein
MVVNGSTDIRVVGNRDIHQPVTEMLRLYRGDISRNDLRSASIASELCSEVVDAIHYIIKCLANASP